MGPSWTAPRPTGLLFFTPPPTSYSFSRPSPPPPLLFNSPIILSEIEGGRGRERERELGKEEKDVGWMIDGENRTDQSPWLRTGEDISSRRRCRDCTFGASLSRTPGARGKPRVQGRSLRHAVSVILPPPVTRPPPENSPGIFSYAPAISSPGRQPTTSSLEHSKKFSYALPKQSTALSTIIDDFPGRRDLLPRSYDRETYDFGGGGERRREERGKIS